MTQGTDRRRSARVELMGRLHGQLISADLPVQVREISLGGMSVETPEGFETGSVLTFVLTLGDGAGVLVATRVVYSRLLGDSSPATYVSGLEFVDEDGESGGVSDLVEKVR
jgi:Tfp pilus assembly protein PilZ